ncbi:hypothetical protein PQS31_09240 [Luteimonas sp BLCC-B24]|uniref:hypothetical protein n=1 Tax=Luteimonas sp. BLCC-B24 TaxID=3025317 RepID=UPI00234CDFF7|nr:hypothetical protein [Luteimonas sp. BLCC-B24]MDC7807003.1 hypothetical protein [Luteimonas sp. BLCC-B24]
MTNRFRAALAGLGLCAALPALAGGASYRLDADLHHQGHALGSATVVLAAGAPGRLQVDGDDGYALTLVVQPEGEVIRVEGRLSRPGRGDPAPEPFAMLLRPGAPARMTTGTFDIGLTVEPVP